MQRRVDEITRQIVESIDTEHGEVRAECRERRERGELRFRNNWQHRQQRRGTQRRNNCNYPHSHLQDSSVRLRSKARLAVQKSPF
jgi:hypothetical protein